MPFHHSNNTPTEQQNNPASSQQQPFSPAAPQQLAPARPADEPPRPDAPAEDSLNVISCGTGQPIDLIYAFIEKDREEEGYRDALVNDDTSYMKDKEDIMRNQLKMLFRRIGLAYRDRLRDLNARLKRTEEAFMQDAVREIQIAQESCNDHINEIVEMEQMLDNDDPRMTTMIQTYRRGFRRGIAAQTTILLNGNNNTL